MKQYNEAISYEASDIGYRVYLNQNEWSALNGEKISHDTYEQLALDVCKQLEKTLPDLIAARKSELIQQSKENLADFFKKAKLISDVHENKECEYSVTLEKQDRLSSLIKNKEYAQINGLPFTAYWNSCGNPGEEWELDELERLSAQIYRYVQPYVLKQQQYEFLVQKCLSLKELELLHEFDI